VEPWNTACQRDHDGLFQSLASHFAHLRTELERDFRAEIYEDPHSPICVIAQDDLQMDSIELTIRTHLQPYPSSQVVRNSIYLRLAHHGYSKGTALAEIQRLLGVTPEHTVAAGDHLNDLPMLHRSYARYLISPQNSVPPVRTRIREQGGYLAQESAGLGVLEGLHALGV
jgi:hydroxymethylpyrimidine pyrophosphatase-like HAD family hydrolase